MSHQDQEPALATVPEGCRLNIYGPPPPVPAVNRLPGGVLLASMGLATDRPGEDMDRLLQLVDEALQEAIPEFLLTEARSTTDAFLIETPYRACRAVVWLLNPRVFSIWADGAGLLQRLLHRWVDDERAREVSPIVYVEDAGSPAGAALASILGAIGLGTRIPESSDGAVIQEFHRPDGLVVSAFAGVRLSASRSELSWHSELSRRRRLALLSGDSSTLERLDIEQREFFERRLAPVRKAGSRAVQWAPRLREHLLQASAGNDAPAIRLLLEHLLQQEAHPVFLVDAASGCAPFIRGPGETPMLEVFPDLLAAQTVLRAGSRNNASAFGDLSVKDLLEWAARERAGIALWLPSSDEQRRCIHLPPDRVRALSGRRQGWLQRLGALLHALE